MEAINKVGASSTFYTWNQGSELGCGKLRRIKMHCKGIIVGVQRLEVGGPWPASCPSCRTESGIAGSITAGLKGSNAFNLRPLGFDLWKLKKSFPHLIKQNMGVIFFSFFHSLPRRAYWLLWSYLHLYLDDSKPCSLSFTAQSTACWAFPAWKFSSKSPQSKYRGFPWIITQLEP